MNFDIPKPATGFKPVLLLSFLLSYTVAANGQTPVKVSASPGFIVLNTDQVSANDNFSETQFIFGGTVSLFTQFLGNPVQVNIGYSRGESTIFSQTIMTNGTGYSINQRYNSIPVEALFTRRIAERAVLAAGLNTVMQYRTLLYNGIDSDDDRILSFGTGLSAQVQLELNEHLSGRLRTVLTLAGRWTEFFIHDSNGRDTSDYMYRHIIFSPQLSFRFLI